jgi:hypothetical protein
MMLPSRLGAILVVALAVFGCSLTNRSMPACGHRELSVSELQRIVDAETQLRGLGAPDPNRSAQIKIKREGCDYLYLEIYPSDQTGAWLFASISSEGLVTSILLGD